MAETWDEARLTADGFERVHVELEWYDGPRFGLGAIDGEPHYFHRDALHDADEYRVWPASPVAIGWEREQWAVFVAWHQRYEAGRAAPGSHPGGGGVHGRYDELQRLLAPHRRMPDDAPRLACDMRFDAGARYRVEGPGYWFRWRRTVQRGT